MSQVSRPFLSDLLISVGSVALALRSEKKLPQLYSLNLQDSALLLQAGFALILFQLGTPLDHHFSFQP